MFHLTGWHREALRARLMQRAQALRNEIAAALHDDEARAALGLDHGRAEPGDAASMAAATDIEIASIERDAAELNAVSEALARMDSGHYGLCEECGGPIAWERLLAQPQARRCIRCESENERRRARPSLPAL